MFTDIIQPSTLDMGSLENNEPEEGLVERCRRSNTLTHHSNVGRLLIGKRDSFLPNLVKQIYSIIYYDKRYLCAAPHTKMLLILAVEGFLFRKKVTENASKKESHRYICDVCINLWNLKFSFTVACL